MRVSSERLAISLSSLIEEHEEAEEGISSRQMLPVKCLEYLVYFMYAGNTDT